MKVSVIIVTYNRERFMPAIYDVYARQTHPDTELRVLDDSDEPSPFFSRLDDPRVHYTHTRERLSIGGKRNRLIEQAQGEWICHFDDDDYYADHYIAHMLAQAGDADFVKLSAWFNFSIAPRLLTYWDTNTLEPAFYRQSGAGLQPVAMGQHDPRQFQRSSLLGFGFSYFHKRHVGLKYPFKEVSFGGDYPMLDAFVQGGGRLQLLRDEEGLVLHQLHGSNVSHVLPQYRLPAFMLGRLFPGHQRYLELTQ
ncbi:MAG: glycosyltransferase [Burkholderiaceae bacterium]